MTPVLPDQPAVEELAALAPALRSRALKAWAERLVHRAVTAAHVDALRALVEAWHGQGAVALPGGTVVRRTGGHLVPDPLRPARGATPTVQRPDARRVGDG
jgi:tRNA(Ile)-lysidine synthase